MWLLTWLLAGGQSSLFGLAGAVIVLSLWVGEVSGLVPFVWFLARLLFVVYHLCFG